MRGHSTTNGKRITYDRATGDFQCWLDGEFIGYAPTYHDAEVKLNALIYDRLRRNVYAERNAR